MIYINMNESLYIKFLYILHDFVTIYIILLILD